MSNEGRRMPQPKGRMMNGMAKGVKLDKDTFKKLMKRITVKHKGSWIAVLVLIVVSVIASIQSSLFIGTLIDDYIAPLLLEDVPVFDSLFKAICQIAIIYVIGAVSTYAYNRVMINISQGVLKEIRDEMFEKMQNLPIKYFDSKSHGDIMSCYVNDIDMSFMQDIHRHRYINQWVLLFEFFHSFLYQGIIKIKMHEIRKFRCDWFCRLQTSMDTAVTQGPLQLIL